MSEKLEKKPLTHSERGKLGGRPEIWTEEAALQLGEQLIAWYEVDEDNIYLKEFLSKRRLHSQIISELTSKWESFSELIKIAKEIQEVRLLKKEGKGEIKSMFVLKNHHGYADKQEVKTENMNYNYDPGDLRQKTADELIELLNAETNTSH
jgi:hypothetical protein